MLVDPGSQRFSPVDKRFGVSRVVGGASADIMPVEPKQQLFPILPGHKIWREGESRQWEKKTGFPI